MKLHPFTRATGLELITPATEQHRDSLVTKLKTLATRRRREAQSLLGAAERIIGHSAGPACTRDGFISVAHAEARAVEIIEAEIARLATLIFRGET